MKSQLARPTGVVARGGAIARETGTAVTVKAAITSGHGATAIVKDAGLAIWRGRPKLPQTMPRVRRRQAADLGSGTLGSSVVEEFISFFFGWGMLAHQGIAKR